MIDKYFEFQFPHDELVFLFVSIITKRKLQNVIVEQKFCLSYNHWPKIRELTNSFYQLLNVTSPNPKNDLILIESFFTTAKLRECLSTSANRNIWDVNTFIRKTFPKEFAFYQRFLENNPFYQELYSPQYLPDFCANLVIYIESVRERYWFPEKTLPLFSRAITISFSTLKGGPIGISAALTEYFIRILAKSPPLFEAKSDRPDSNELCRACVRFSRYHRMHCLQNDSFFL
nr:hypothetical protein [Enterococcus innesii]